ncbi:MAG: penicillin acylase family protein [Gemmatimonadales bacterium]|nr:penicillin acylase family protein [Gemmatimonadales bacterium]
MKPGPLRLALAVVLLGALGYLSVRGAGPVPPLGPLLDPANGVFGLARYAEIPKRGAAQIPGITAPVEVRYDDRGVPHVFASTEEDAWRAQGFLVARDRLFQMELQIRAAAGTLTELVGARALEADKTARRRGLAWAALRNYAALDSADLMSRASRAYADGVNAYIGSMRRAALPLEYRLLNRRPFRWEPEYTFYFFGQMSLTLAYEDQTTSRLRARALVGAQATEALFPLNSPIQEPIQPNGIGRPRYDFTPLAAPGDPDTTVTLAIQEREAVMLALGLSPGRPGLRDAIGSNNWVVAPGRTAGGHALLSGDPHLELSLPSIWYEIHLVTAGGSDVAGVTFAGSPGVIIGFNRDVAWSFTNTGADVRDHYAETVDDTLSPRRYRVDGEWRPLTRQVERFRGPRGEPIGSDTLFFTHRGPMVRALGRWLSIRWTPFEAAGAGGDFLRLADTRNVQEWLDAWKDHAAPAQNGAAADRAGAIAMRSTGWYPVRPGNGRGDEIRDGSTSASDWKGYLPLSAYPVSVNPPQGFLASANQQPVDPKQNPHYFGSNWYSPWRAMRINEMLRADSAVTPESMRAFQTDPKSVRAAAFIPLFRNVAGSGSGAALIGEWDGRYTKENRRAVLFEAAMDALDLLVWDELIPVDRRSDSAARPVQVPAEAVLLGLMADSTSAWWDDRRTPAVERRDEILRKAADQALAAVRQRLGSDEARWVWSAVHSANIHHLLRLPALSSLNLPVEGGSGTVSPSPGGGEHGPSWRMVVELGPDVRAWAVYPGGQSGNPASSRYLDRLPKWLGGQLDEVLFPHVPAEIPAERLRGTLVLTGGR